MENNTSSSENTQAFMAKEKNFPGNNGDLSCKNILNWLEEYQEFMVRFQTLEYLKDIMKLQGNKYGIYTQEVIDLTYKTRKV